MLGRARLVARTGAYRTYGSQTDVLQLQSRIVAYGRKAAETDPTVSAAGCEHLRTPPGVPYR